MAKQVYIGEREGVYDVFASVITPQDGLCFLIANGDYFELWPVDECRPHSESAARPQKGCDKSPQEKMDGKPFFTATHDEDESESPIALRAIRIKDTMEREGYGVRSIEVEKGGSVIIHAYPKKEDPRA